MATKKEDQPKMNLQQKLLQAKKRVPYFKKDKAGHQYKYASPDVVLGTLNPILNELGIRLKTEIIDVHTEKVFAKPRGFDVFIDGKKTTQVHDVYETMYHIKFRMTWIDVDTDERDENMWFASGVNGHELGAGSSCTYAERYFLLKQFNIPTGDDDPDSFQNRHMSDEEKNRLAAEEAAKQLEHIESIKNAAISALKSFKTTDQFNGFKEAHSEALRIKDVSEFSKKRFEEVKKAQEKSESNPAGLLKKQDPNDSITDKGSTTVGEMLMAIATPTEVLSQVDEAIDEISKYTNTQELSTWALSKVKSFERFKEPKEKIEEFKLKVNTAVTSLIATNPQ